jgi:hypothetical protein
MGNDLRLVSVWTDQQKNEELRKAIAALLRQTADPDPLHPAFMAARERAADVYQRTST